MNEEKSEKIKQLWDYKSIIFLKIFWTLVLSDTS